MKRLKQATEIIKEDVRATKRSLFRSFKKSGDHVKTLSYVFSKPVNTAYGILAGSISVAVAIWLANVQILQQLFSSSSIALSTQLSFLVSMFPTILRNVDTLQLWLIGLFMVGSILLWAFWIEALRLQHDNDKHRERFAPLLAASLIAASIGIIGVSLVTPVITRDGLSIFVSQHFSGTIILGLAIIMQAKIVHLFMHRLYPIAERARDF